MEIKTIGLACDHAGFPLMQRVKTWLRAAGYDFKDFGTYSADSCDYPDYAHALAEAMKGDDIYPGIAICGTGEGISMTLNKHQHIRAALCWKAEIAELTRQHNDANVLVMAGRYTTEEEAQQIVKTFLTTDFEGGRHQRRLDKMAVKGMPE